MANGLFTLKQQLQGAIQYSWSGQKTPAVEYLVVAGGGAGGDNSNPSNGNGGGGAGGLLQGITPITPSATFVVTIGAGSGRFSNKGCNSLFGPITAIGGGTGARFCSHVAYSGGSGAGGASACSYSRGAAGYFGQGNTGGSGLPCNSGGGGGGAGSVGANGTASSGGNGGMGIASAISGTVTTYAGGGAGGARNGFAHGLGGVGGGGSATGGCGTSGSANTGGGGAPGCNNTSAGSGGSGIVIISYSDTYNAPTALTGTYTASTSGSGSLSFNGSSQWLSYGSASNWTFLNNGSTFTVEAWVYPTSTLTGTNTLIATGYNSASIGFNIWLGNATNNDVFAVFYNSGTYSDFYTSTNAITINAWNHIAVTYNSSGTTAAIYVNGVSQSLTFGGTSLSSFTFPSSAPSYPLRVASTQNGAYYFPGYMSNVRITNTLVYSSNFTPSTTPLKPVSGTQFLLSTVSPNGYLDSSTNGYTYTLTGTPSWNQLSPFATGLGYKNRVYTWTGSGTVTF